MRQADTKLFKYFSAFIVWFSLLGSVFASCRSSALERKTLTIQNSEGKSVLVKAEIADRPETREKGFMFRKKIPDGTGMLFVFDRDQILSFWMKNTPSPLSIAFITSDGRIKDIFDMTPFSLASTVSTGYVRYALEVPQGWFSRQNIKTGDRLVIDFQ